MDDILACRLIELFAGQFQFGFGGVHVLGSHSLPDLADLRLQHRLHGTIAITAFYVLTKSFLGAISGGHSWEFFLGEFFLGGVFLKGIFFWRLEQVRQSKRGGNRLVKKSGVFMTNASQFV